MLEQVCKSVLPPQSIVWQQHTLEAGIEAIRQRLRPLEARRSGVSPDPSLCHPERSEGSVGWQPVPAAGGSRYAAGTPVPATSDGGVGPVGRGLCPAPIAEGAGDTEPGLRQPLRGRSRLLIDPACATLIREFNLYRRREHQEGTDLQPRPIKELNRPFAKSYRFLRRGCLLAEFRPRDASHKPPLKLFDPGERTCSEHRIDESDRFVKQRPVTAMYTVRKRREHDLLIARRNAF